MGSIAFGKTCCSNVWQQILSYGLFELSLVHAKSYAMNLTTNCKSGWIPSEGARAGDKLATFFSYQDRHTYMASKENDFAKILKRVGVECRLRHQRTLTSAVTTAWGVNWDEDYIARDLMQNFFDANRDNLGSVRVSTHGADVLVNAPAAFKLERLFYLGSEKGESDVGQYGEGFKVAATCLLRDHSVSPIVASGNEVVCLRVSEKNVTDTQMYPVEYDFFMNENEVNGTLLVLPGCSKRLADAVIRGLTHFFYNGNPLLGAKRWSDYTGDFSIYDSSDRNGHVFYRNLKRGEIEGIPVVLVINKQYQLIERRISKDRDRNAFGSEVMKMFYNHFAKYGLKHRMEGQRVIVEAAHSSWERGHALLSELAETWGYRTQWPSAASSEVFCDKYFSRSVSNNDNAKRLEIERMERVWSEEGRLPLPSYFQRFGVISAEVEITRRTEAADNEAKNKNKRKPTKAEHGAIELLFGILKQLAPDIAAVFERSTIIYTVARTQTILGQLKSDRSYRSREVFLAESVLVAEFPEALAIFLHEHAHIFGYDGSRAFTDALTELLETIIRYRSELEAFNASWNTAKEVVENERLEISSEVSGDRNLQKWIESMEEDELRTLLEKIPVVVLQRLRQRASDTKDDRQ